MGRSLTEVAEGTRHSSAVGHMSVHLVQSKDTTHIPSNRTHSLRELTIHFVVVPPTKVYHLERERVEYSLMTCPDLNQSIPMRCPDFRG